MRISKLDFSELFSVSQKVDGKVFLVETPFVFPGADDKIVIRVRPEGGVRVDDGGDTEWFASIVGCDIYTSLGRSVCK